VDQRLTFESEGIELPAKTSSPKIKPTLVLCHGYPGTNFNEETASALADLGFGIILFRYRGVLTNSGRHSLRGNERDIRSAVNAAESRGWQRHGLGLLGYSFGGFHAIRVAASDPKRVNFLVLMAPAANIGGLKAHLDSITPNGFRDFIFSGNDMLVGNPRDWLMEAKGFTNDEQPTNLAKGLRIPLLILHGGRDEVVPLGLSKLLEGAWGGPRKLVVLDTDHDFKGMGTRVATEVSAFVREQGIH